MSDCDNENIIGALILLINRDPLSNEITNFMNVIRKKIPIEKSNVPNIIWKLPNLVGKKENKTTQSYLSCKYKTMFAIMDK